MHRPDPGHRVSFIRAKYKHNKGQNKTEITREMADLFIKSLEFHLSVIVEHRCLKKTA